MPDNVAVTAGTGTAIASDDIGAVQFQRIKLIHGIDGVNDGDVSTVNGLPVNIVSAVSTVSVVNSTTAVLAAAAVFTGTSEDVSRFASIQVAVFASHASATDGLSVQQSTNGTDWDFSDVYTVQAAAGGRVFGFQPVARFFRIVYTNGATLQTAFRLQTVYHLNAARTSSQRPGDGYTNEVDLDQTQSFQMVWNGTSWDRLRNINSGRNATNYFEVAPVITTTAEVMRSLTGYKGGVAVAATPTPAVVSAGRTWRISQIIATYIAATVIGSARITLRVNPAGVAVVGSPLAWSGQIGMPAIFTAGAADTRTFDFPEGLDIPAGAGVAIGVQGFGAVPTTATIAGFVMVSINGFEF